jgi:hypothetical protein
MVRARVHVFALSVRAWVHERRDVLHVCEFGMRAVQVVGVGIIPGFNAG